MSGQAVLAELRKRGARIRRRGGRLEVAPRSALDDGLRTEIRSHRAEILASLGDLGEAPIVEARVDIGAVLLGGPYGEVWLALTDHDAIALRAQEAREAQPRPVLEHDDVLALRGKEKGVQAAVLRVFAVFPGAEILK